MNEYSEEDKLFLLNLARKSIEYFMEKRELLTIDAEKIKNKLKEKKAVFVTLEKHGLLRGCIGVLQAVEPLYLAVIKNAVAAAFYDTRFFPLSEGELKHIKIEISILTKPEKIDYKNVEELLKKIKVGDGIIIKLGKRSATFLPQVWEKLSSKEIFLSELCLKAGLSSDEWRKGKLEVYRYKVVCFKES
ncbi:MAG: AmmeMemoRadiSam system protein A [Candidatus Aenigmarchaeota archaeon]|nr:AmmeMemoRadiSam system protein A [Candidatus Aenigmarchaeota archaeon]